MHQLRLVAVSEDGSYAILAVRGRGGRFSLPIDDRLRAVARGQFSRLAQYEIEVENPLRPKEIQDRIRAGETAEEIADAAGIPIERVRRFEGPVLAEREYRAQEAQRATVRSPGDSGPGPRLGEVVAERLTALGVVPDDALWDSRKRADGNWQVQLAFTMGGRPQVAEWIFDPRRRHVSPDDDDAARLCLPEDDLPAIRFAGRKPATATVTPIASRLAGPVVHPSEQRPSHAEHRAPDMPPISAAAAAGPPAQSLPPAPSRSAAQSHAAQSHPAAQSRPAAPSGASAVPAAREPDGDHRSELETAAPDGNPSPARERPVRKAAGGRSRRASVPSWDEIMFGNSRQPD